MSNMCFAPLRPARIGALLSTPSDWGFQSAARRALTPNSSIRHCLLMTAFLLSRGTNANDGWRLWAGRVDSIVVDARGRSRRCSWSSMQGDGSRRSRELPAYRSEFQDRPFPRSASISMKISPTCGCAARIRASSRSTASTSARRHTRPEADVVVEEHPPRRKLHRQELRSLALSARSPRRRSRPSSEHATR